MRTLNAIASACALLPGLALAQTAPAGHWEGNIQTPDREITIVLDLAKNDKGAWVGTLAQPEQNVKGAPLTDIQVAEKNVKFRLAPSANAPSMDCTVTSETAMKCAITGPGGDVSADFKRTGDAKVELPKAEAAVSKELEGDWEGVLDTPMGSLHLVVHFKNQPDKTLKATLDSPDQGATDLPLNDVAQKGTAVEFQLRMVGGAFKGALNKEATEMAGDWSQGGGSLPLTLKKKKA